MSGTSLDGIDAAIATFELEAEEWKFEINWAKTYRYNNEWLQILSNAHKLDGVSLTQLDRDYGVYLSGIVKNAIGESKITPGLIASHGHTIFHNPAGGYTLQIGHGGCLAVRTGINVVSDFRSTDIALGGQGAPLVPYGDKHLFSQYHACLNLGGFANISFDENGVRKAFDICPVNIVLNQFARVLGFEYDDSGHLGRKGVADTKLLEKLNNLAFYHQNSPKSLGREWVENEFMVILEQSGASIQSKMSTVYEHIAIQISNVLNIYEIKDVLLTGGGAYNTFLFEQLKSRSNAHIVLPEPLVIEFKEALVFAFLGLSRMLNKENCYASVTGASRDSICGAYYSA